VQTAEKQGIRMDILSFMPDLDPLRLALRHPHKFGFLRHAAPYALLENGEWRSPDNKITWTISKSDLNEQKLKGLKPDIILRAEKA
jgi:hypothetical protein